MDFFKFFKKGEKSDALINEKKLLESKAQAKREADIEKKLFLPKKEEEQIKQLAKIWRPKPINVEKVFGRDEIIVSKTDTRGNIIYGNSLFVKMAGYTQDEMLGQPHSIIRHPDMPKIVFKALWDTVSQGKEINAFVVNLAKGGEYYWVFANVTPSYDKNHHIIGYHSVRRQPNPKALEIIKSFYSDLRKAEVIGGMHESGKLLGSLLNTHKMSYEQLIYHLQYNL